MIRTTYKRRRDLIVTSIDTYFPGNIQYIKPSGCLFIWITLPSDIDAKVILEEAIAHRVAFVPGGSFFPNGGHEKTMRLNFSTMNDDKIVEGMKRLGAVLHQNII